MCLDESTELSVTGGLETDTVGPLPAAGDTQPMAADNDQDYNYINEQFRCGASPILL